MGPIEVLGVEDLPANLARVAHIVVLPVCALNVELDGLGSTKKSSANPAGVIRTHVLLNEVLEGSHAI